MREQTSDILLSLKRRHIKISVAKVFCPLNLWNSENMSDDFCFVLFSHGKFLQWKTELIFLYSIYTVVNKWAIYGAQ